MYLFSLCIRSHPAWVGEAKVSLGETAEGLLQWISRYAIGDTPSVEADREGEAEGEICSPHPAHEGQARHSLPLD